jgi:hypothetical protein
VENYVSQLLNEHSVTGVRQIEIPTAEPLARHSSPFKIEIAIAKLGKYKSPGSNQILADLIQGESEILRSEIHKFSNTIWDRKEFPEQWKKSFFN